MIIYITDIDKFDNEKSFLENIKLASFYGINFIQIFKFHISRKSIVHYYGVLGIPNISYINKIFEDLINTDHENCFEEFKKVIEFI